MSAVIFLDKNFDPSIHIMTRRPRFPSVQEFLRRNI